MNKSLLIGNIIEMCMNSQQESEIHSRLTYIGRNLDEIWKALDRIEKMLRMRKCDDSKSV